MFAQKTIPSTLGKQSGLQEMCCKQQKFEHLIKENRYFMQLFAILGRGDTELN
jgi:hypothetical protein